MLEIIIPATEQWDEETQQFVYTKEQTLRLEHSLVSISKWESKWHKSFFAKNDLTPEENIDYIRCMTITQNVDPSVYYCITREQMKAIKNYMEDPMTATTFSQDSTKQTSREIITSELVYYWMISLNIPMECQKWHFNRLLTLVKVCNIKNQPPKKRSSRDVMSQNTALNAARRKQFNSKG